MKRATASIAVALGLGVLLAAGPSGVAEADETTEICAEADQRYEAMETAADAKPGVVIVKMLKYTFCPPDLTIEAGTTVRWINVEKRTSHSVWFKAAGKEESERLFPEEGWSITFDAAGENPYICGPHGEQEGMVGKVTVTQ
jgi:plastocyanin